MICALLTWQPVWAKPRDCAILPIPDAKQLQEAGLLVYDYKCNNLGLDPGSLGSETMNPPRTIIFSTPNEAPAGQLAIEAQRPHDLTGCPWHDVKSMLRDVGLRPTRQRMALGWILFAKGDRHLTAEMLYEEATKAKVPVSLATVYNTLHQFTEVGLLRQVAVDGSKTYFDTNASEHHHFFVEGENELVDIPGADVIVDKMPVAPEGYEIARIDVVVRLKKADRRR
jgi:Fur family iron response transcriptional regulator